MNLPNVAQASQPARAEHLDGGKTRTRPDAGWEACATKFLLLLSLFGLEGICAPTQVLPTEAKVSVIGHAWAGDPVSFAILTERGHQFVAFYDGDRRLNVAGRSLDSDGWTIVKPEGHDVPARGRSSNVTGWDSHNYLRLALDRDGFLHVTGNMHVEPLVYYRTRRPLEVSTLERIDFMTGELEEHCTYPVFFKNAAGDLLFRYRDGSAGKGNDLYDIYDTATRRWHRLLSTPLLDGQDKRNAYALEPTLGPDGYFHLVWMWREAWDCSTNHTLSYARSRDLLHWEDSHGKALELPITLSRCDVIDPSKQKEGLMNMTFQLGFDDQKKPVAVYHRYDAQGHSQIYAARPTSTGWEVHPLTQWNFRWAFGGLGSVPAEVILGEPRLTSRETLLIDFDSSAIGAGRLQVNAKTLEPLAPLPAGPKPLPARLLAPESSFAGMEVQTMVSHYGSKLYVLRWETLPRNRDEPRAQVPPASELRVYEMPDADVNNARQIGS